MDNKINIKFEIHKVSNNKYNYKLHYISSKFKEKLFDKVIHIDFKSKKIFRNSSWRMAYINNDRLTIYFSDNDVIEVKTWGENAYLDYNFFLNESSSTIETDIKDFDKILIKGLKILSDTFNKGRK